MYVVNRLKMILDGANRSHRAIAEGPKLSLD